MNPKLVIALFFLASGTVVAAAVYSAVEGPKFLGLGWSDGCDLDITGSTPAAVDESVTTKQASGKWTATRTLSYRLPAMAEGAVHLCADTGSLRLEAGAADHILVEAKVHGHATTEAAARDAAAQLDPEVRGLDDAVWAWHPAGQARYHQGVGATLSFRVLVPPQMLVDARLDTDTGGVHVDGVRLTGLRATADTGGVSVDVPWARGQLEGHTDTGGVHAAFAALDDATMAFGTDTGGVDVFVPGGARYGYDVAVDTDTGGVGITLPDTEDVDRASRDHRHVRTRGFDQREVQVTIDARTDTGGVHVGVA